MVFFANSYPVIACAGLVGIVVVSRVSGGFASVGWVDNSVVQSAIKTVMFMMGYFLIEDVQAYGVGYHQDDVIAVFPNTCRCLFRVRKLYATLVLVCWWWCWAICKRQIVMYLVLVRQNVVCSELVVILFRG